MARRKSDFLEEEQNIIPALLREYDIQDAMKDLLGKTKVENTGLKY